MHNAAFAARGLDWAYVPLPVAEGGLPDALRGLVALGFAGANVTAPYKLEASELSVTDLDSVNTLVVSGDVLEGYSTDATILAGLDTARPAIVGGGGSAAAFRAALPEAGVFSRRGDWPPDVSEADLVVHATSERTEVLFVLVPGQTLIDLPYPETATGRAAREAGVTVVTGLDVLAAQGAAAFELWTGLPAPLAVMRAALGLSEAVRG